MTGMRRLRRAGMVGAPLACALLSAAILTGVIGGAQADPVVPSQNQVNQASQAAGQAKAAVSPAQAALEAAQKHLAQFEAAAQQAQQRYAAATAGYLMIGLVITGVMHAIATRLNASVVRTA